MKNDKWLSYIVAILCALQAFDAPDLAREGKIAAAIVVALAAVIGAMMGISNARRGDRAPATPDPPNQPRGVFYGQQWTTRINASFFCYFLANVIVSFSRPWSARSFTGVIGVIGVVGTTAFAVVRATRALRGRKTG